MKTYTWISSLKSRHSTLTHHPVGTIQARAEIKPNIDDVYMCVCVYICCLLILKYIDTHIYMLPTVFSGHFNVPFLLKKDMKWVYFWMLKCIYMRAGCSSKACKFKCLLSVQQQVSRCHPGTTFQQFSGKRNCDLSNSWYSVSSLANEYFSGWF